jgi:hypothetical protein
VGAPSLPSVLGEVEPALSEVEGVGLLTFYGASDLNLRPLLRRTFAASHTRTHSLPRRFTANFFGHNYAFAPRWRATVLQVLSSAWQVFSSGQSMHLGERAKHSLRPCQMT